jgi:hypothetical protein
MLLDTLVVLGLNLWENRLKAEKAKVAHEETVEHETDKKASRATRASTRKQRKADDKKQKHDTKGQVSFTPNHTINQPKKQM